MEPSIPETCAQEVNAVLTKYDCSIICERVDVPNGFLFKPVIRLNAPNDTQQERSEEAKGESNEAPSNN
jgi:hypothetical protein